MTLTQERKQELDKLLYEVMEIHKLLGIEAAPIFGEYLAELEIWVRMANE